MISRFWTKPVAAALIGSFLLPLSLVWTPLRADAAASNCAAVVAGAIASIAPIAAAEKTLGVTISSGAQTTAGTISAGSGYGTFFKDCILTPLAIRLAKAMLQNITYSIVNWINNGFHGSPAFVQDLHGLVQDTTDQAIGDFINNDLGGGFLCNSFSFQVRVAVAQSYMPYQRRAACTLSQISQNVQGFIQNDNSGGWNNWLEVTTVPQNNVYGATVLAENELSSVITNKLAVQNRTLDWGKGFRSWQECTQWSKPPSDAQRSAGLNLSATADASAIAASISGDYMGAAQANAISAASTAVNTQPSCLHYETKTPGIVVESQLETALGSGIRQLEVANDIDAIVGALTNQLMSKVITGAQGLLGAGNSSDGSSGTQSYQDAIAGNISDPSLAQAIDTGIQDSTQNANLSAMFTESSATDASTTAVTTGNDGNSGAPTKTVTPDTHISVTETPTDVTYSTALSYKLALSTNVATSGIAVRTTLEKSGNPVAFLTPFDTFRVAYGPENGVLSVKTIDRDTDASILWSPINMKGNSTLVFEFTGDKAMASRSGTVYTGDYELKTDLIDAGGSVIQSIYSPFTIN